MYLLGLELVDNVASNKLNAIFVSVMRKIYQKLAYTIMITAFAWVVIGDLVNMHMKIIYEKDLCAHNTFFTKTISKDKSSYKLSAKKNNSNHSFSNFININILTAHLIPVTDIKFHEELLSNLILLQNSNCNLRGPPTL